MRLLLILIFGTLIFGVAFPAFIFILAFFLFIFIVLALFSFFTGAFGGSKHVIIYKNGKRADSFRERDGGKHTADNPEIIGGADYGRDGDAYDFGDEAEPEIVELPPSALRKEGEEVDGE